MRRTAGASHVSQQSGRQARCYVRLAGKDRTNNLDQFRSTHSFENIGSGTCLECRQHVFLILRHREHDDLYDWTGAHDVSSSVDTAAAHTDIEKHHVRQQFAGESICVVSRLTLANDLEVML